MWVLELSKVPMYEFHYHFIKKIWKKKERLLLTDPDSLIYKSETENVYDGFGKNKKCLILVIILLTQNVTMI